MTLDPEQPARQRGLVLLNKAERMIDDLAPAIDRIPRHQRYRYGQRLENGLWELVHRIIEAAASGQKSKVYRLDEHLRYIHALLRHGASRKFLTARRVGMTVQQLKGIGAMVGAWRHRLK